MEALAGEMELQEEQRSGKETRWTERINEDVDMGSGNEVETVYVVYDQRVNRG